MLMKDDIQNQIRSAILSALRPIARLLLRTGIGYREFNELAKAAFVSVATSEYGLRGRPTNISRVAVMTGLTRKEIKRIREKDLESEKGITARSTPLGEVLHRWFSDQDFIDEHGKPKAIPFDGDAYSFVDLVKRTGGDIPPGAMRTELRRIGAIQKTEEDLLIPIKRNVIAEELHDRVITGLIRGVRPIAVTIVHNTDQTNAVDPWTQRTVSTQFVRQKDIGRVRRISRDRLNEFTEQMDDLYSAYESFRAGEEDEEDGAKVIGVGVFYFEEDVEQEK